MAWRRTAGGVSRWQLFGPADAEAFVPAAPLRQQWHPESALDEVAGLIRTFLAKQRLAA
jgi:hypothetical protein